MRKPLHTRSILAGIAIYAMLAAGSVYAQQGARTFLKKRHDSVAAILRKPVKTDAARENRNAELDRILGTLLDFDELSRRTLRDHWKGLAEAQRTEFSKLFVNLIERSYRKNLESTLDYAIRYEGESPGPGGVVVHTVARSKKNRRAPEIVIDYALGKSDGGWKVFDVTTDGVSLVDNYRNQFNRIIKRKGWEGLIAKMRARLESGSGTL
jgi:phospholipid transport system substrate-binding protein